MISRTGLDCSIKRDAAQKIEIDGPDVGRRMIEI